MEKAFKKRSIVVNGVEVVFDAKEDLQIAALSGDMDKVASQMGFWGSVWASAVVEQANVNAQYRHWRAKATETILEKDPKLAEWKVKAKIEADPGFIKYKATIAFVDGNVTLAKATFDSFNKKSNILQSKGAMSRSELDATGMTTPEVPKPKPKMRYMPSLNSKTATDSAVLLEREPAKYFPAQDDSRVSAMRNIFSKK